MSDQKISKNGVQYARVTEILSAYTNLSMIPPMILKHAADRGTRVHQACNLYVQDLLFGAVLEEDAPYIQAFVDWYEENVRHIYMTEKRLFSEVYKFTGQCDIVCDVKGFDGPCVIDYKTCLKPYKTWGLQTAAYMLLCEQNGLKVKNRLVLQLTKKETSKMYVFPNHMLEKRIFINLVHAHQYFLSI